MKKVGETNEKLIRNNIINLNQIVFEVTEMCNLNCKYCRLSDLYQKEKVIENRDLSFKKIAINY